MFKAKNKKSKNKLSKKDKFKELKKEVIPMNKAPLFLKNIYGISAITDSGLTKLDNGYFSKLYRLEINDFSIKSSDVFEILRQYDCKFRVYDVKDNIYLNILFKTEKSDVWVSCDELYKDMENKFHALKISVVDINANERMKIIHTLILDDTNCTFDYPYIDNNFILNWKGDFELSNIEEAVDQFHKKNDKYKVYFVREFSDKMSEFISEISNMDEVSEIITQFEPISDSAVRAFIENSYMGIENTIENMAYSNPKMYQLFVNDNNDDNRTFTICSVMFLVNVNDPETEEKIEFSASRYNLEISYFHVNLKDVYKEFLPIGQWKYENSRNVRSDVADKIFLPNYFSHGKEMDIDDMLLDSSMFEFDKKNTINLNNIDEYSEEEDEDNE